MTQSSTIEPSTPLVTKPLDNEQVWEDFLATHPESNFLQSWYWGEFHKNLGRKVFRTGVYHQNEISNPGSDQGNDDQSQSQNSNDFLAQSPPHEHKQTQNQNQLVGIMLCIIEDAKRGRYLTVPGGPIIDWQDDAQVQAFMTEIRSIAKANNCVFVRVRPQLEENEFSINLFERLGFKVAPIHLHAELTSQLDITTSEDELLMNMRKATRYEVKKALSLGITVTATQNPEAMKKFYDLQILTSKRQGFVPFPYEFLYEQFKTFTAVNKAVLYSAEYQGKLLAQAFIIFYGEEAAYHYGASTEDGRKFPGAYLIQWTAIKEAKARGIKRYNFWGVAPEEDKAHRFSGLSMFKRGFGGHDFAYLHARDLVMNPVRYLLNTSIENIRKRIRHV